MAFILFSEQLVTVFGLVFNLNFIQSDDLSGLNNAGSKKSNNFCSHCPILPEPTQFFSKITRPGSNRHFFLPDSTLY